MKVKHCRLNATAVSMAPLQRTEPEESWTKARAQGAIQTLSSTFTEELTIFPSVHRETVGKQVSAHN
jgi:hypothetical protein